MFTERVLVTMKFHGVAGIPESHMAARWLQTQMDSLHKFWLAPDPVKFAKLKHRKDADKKAINEAYQQEIESCPEWRAYVMLRKQAFEKYNKGRWLPVNPQIEKKDN